ncbi:MAG: formate dehydrogenase subunit alpha [Gammaproteobacteria bacterium]|nr:formate dehydrogenase subunit alpha [Gammaproteobacteria bacterium]
MYAIDHKDLGTPAAASGESVTLDIDGSTVTVPVGTSVMRAAALAGGQIPKLCATDSLKAFGSCRLCLVEIEGRKGFPASCTTEVAAGMKVRTQSARLQKLRRGVVELYVSDHPLDCDECPANGHCELQDAAEELGVEGSRYANGGATQRGVAQDASNPYFVFNPDLCIVCSRCVRACDEVQGTLALTIEGRGFDSRVSASQHQPFLESECVSCGACVEACPTAALTEKLPLSLGAPTEAVSTTCGYCGVGCSLKAEVKEETVVRMVPNRAGTANNGHACVKGRFAFGYATHADRVRSPMIRKRITDPWREVSWEEAFAYTAAEFKRIRKKYGPDSVGGITSSRCTNEETFLVQKLVRAALGTNNVDTCARVCHSATGYGLKHTLGESAGTQAFTSVNNADVIVLIGANPTDGHPVFASQLKRRLRQGAKLIVLDPRAIDLVRTPHIEAVAHLPLRPGTNVAVMNALSHVIVTEGLANDAYAEARCEVDTYRKWKAFVADPRNSPESTEAISGVPAALVRKAARIYAAGPNSAIYYGLGVTEHSQGTTMVMAIANIAMATGNLGREGVGVSPLRGQNNVQGSCDMGSFPHEFSGYRHVSDAATRSLFEGAWNAKLASEPGLRIPNMFEAALDGSFRGLYIQGEDFVQSDPNTNHVVAALSAMECVVVQDLFLIETARYAHVFLPGSTFLEKDGTFTNAERRISRVRKVMEPLAGLADWEITMRLAQALGYPMHYSHPSEIMDEIARLTPTFRGVNYEKLERLGSIQWPCNDAAPEGTPTMHVDSFVRGKGKFYVTEYVATSERSTSRFPLLLTTGRVLYQYNVGTQTRRTSNLAWQSEDRLEIHPDDAEDRGIANGDWVGVTSRAGDTVMRAVVSRRMTPGVVYTTFHFPESGVNLVTTENSDWATNCPEYKVTAVEVVRVGHPEAWQERIRAERSAQRSPAMPSA